MTPTEQALEILDRAVQAHKPSHVFAMFSGGHDSLCAAYVTSLHPAFSGAVHINTGIGVEQTRAFVRETCASRGWPLQELHPPQRTYEDLILQYGFPGPASHSFMYRYLKERAVRVLIRSHKRHHRDRILLVTGVRLQESVRRMGNVSEQQREGCKVWVAPLLNWSKAEINDCIEQAGLRRSPVVDAIHFSGECLCGAFARPGELEEIRFWYPETAAQITALEARAQAAGLGRCRWGEGNRRGRKAPGPLCASCVGEGEDLLSDGTVIAEMRQ